MNVGRRDIVSSRADIDNHEYHEASDYHVADPVVHLRSGGLELLVVVRGHFANSKEMSKLNERQSEGGRKEKSNRVGSLARSEDVQSIFRQPSVTAALRIPDLADHLHWSVYFLEVTVLVKK